MILPEIVVHMLETLKTFGQVLVVQLRGEVVRVLLAQSFRTEYVESVKKYESFRNPFLTHWIGSTGTVRTNVQKDLNKRKHKHKH